MRRDMLFRQVDDAYATILRQAFFALLNAGARDDRAGRLGGRDGGRLTWKTCKTQFGEAVEVSEEFKWEWVSIPHIYQRAVLRICLHLRPTAGAFAVPAVKQEGEGFKPRYLKILSTGGSEAPAKVLSQAGIDIHDRAFWQGGFDVVRGLVDQLEAIPVKK